MKTKYLLFLSIYLIISPYLTFSQGLTNNGASIIVESGATLVVDGNLVNQSLVNSHGSISLEGSIKLTGDFTNNATAGDVFSTNTGTLLFTGLGNQEVNGSRVSNFGSIVLNNNVEFNQISQQMVSNISLESGKLIIDDVDFKINPSANITNYNATNYIVADGVGKLVQTINNGETAFFPIGSATRYAPVTITQANGADDGDFKVRVVDNVLLYATSGNQVDTSKKYVNKTWFIEATASTLDLDIKLSWTADDQMNGFDPQNCYISHYNSSDSVWDFSNQWGAPASQNAGVYSITRSGVSSLSPFTVGDVSTGPLPVTLLYFTGRASNQDVLLSWITTSEINNRGFEIYKSTDAQNFELIGFVDGAGNSNIFNNYEYPDLGAASSDGSILYYQLRQIDFDGSADYSNIIAIKSSDNQDTKLTIYPNPTSGLVKIAGSDLCSQFEVYDLCGKKLMICKADAPGLFDLSALAKGVYQLVSDENGVRKTARVLVK